MDVSYSNQLTNTISYFRKNLYNTEEFKQLFSINLKNVLNAKSIGFTPDQFGGWIVSILMEDSNCSIYSSNYINTVREVLLNTLSILDTSDNIKNIDSNFINITVTGQNTIIVKI